MKDSFYYFFSATPQVLGGILALFGVFIIFKLETLKVQLKVLKELLLNLGMVIHKEIQPPLIKEINKRLTKEGEDKPFITRWIDAIRVEDNEEFLIYFDEFMKITHDSGIKSLLNQLASTYIIKCKRTTENIEIIKAKIKSLSMVTLRWSMFTAGIIVICLTILTQGKYFVCHPYLLLIVFMLIIVLILICFSWLIFTLYKSLKES